MYGEMVQVASYNQTEAIRLENIPKFQNWNFSPYRILLSKVGNLSPNQINAKLQSNQANSPYDKNFGNINSATVQAITWIHGQYNPKTVLQKLISDKAHPKIIEEYNTVFKSNPNFNFYDDLIIAFALEHNDTILQWNKAETGKFRKRVLPIELFNQAINIKKVEKKASPKKDKIINAPANVAKQTDEDTVREVIDKQVIEISKVKESPQTLEDERPEIQVSTNYYLIGLVALIAVSLFFIMRMRK